MPLTSNPFFTIIIPTKNSGETLALAFESIFSQTFQNYEILILDSYSRDGTAEIVHNYQKNHPELCLVQQYDTGIYDAMNKGVKIAKGDWIYFMGSDDKLYSRNVLEKIATSKFVTQVDVIYGNVFSTRFNGVYDGEFTYSKFFYKNICHQAIFFKKGVFSTIGDFNCKYRSHADYDHNIRWFFSSEIKAAYLDLIIADYADGGFSSNNPDHVFRRDKSFKLLKHGFGKFSLSYLLFLLRDILQQNDFYKPLKTKMKG